MSECTDGLGADVGTQLERVNKHCVTGFPDVHMMLIMTQLNGTLEAETINPESEEKKECRVEVQDKTRARMTEYISDYFTDETFLRDQAMHSMEVVSTTILRKVRITWMRTFLNFVWKPGQEERLTNVSKWLQDR